MFGSTSSIASVIVNQTIDRRVGNFLGLPRKVCLLFPAASGEPYRLASELTGLEAARSRIRLEQRSDKADCWPLETESSTEPSRSVQLTDRKAY